MFLKLQEINITYISKDPNRLNCGNFPLLYCALILSNNHSPPSPCQIQDASLGGSSDDEDFLGVLRGPSTFANAFLYVGLGTVALGLVIAFVGTGEKGFKTVELRLIGPSLIGNTISLLLYS